MLKSCKGIGSDLKAWWIEVGGILQMTDTLYSSRNLTIHMLRLQVLIHTIGSIRTTSGARCQAWIKSLTGRDPCVVPIRARSCPASNQSWGEVRSIALRGMPGTASQLFASHILSRPALVLSQLRQVGHPNGIRTRCAGSRWRSTGGAYLAITN